MYISFQLKKGKTNKKGLAPINLRITLDTKRLELSTHRRIHPDSWDNKTGYALGTNDDTVILNNYLDSLKSKVQRQYNILESLDKEITLDAIRNRLTGQTVKTHTLIEVFNYNNDEVKSKIGIDVTASTHKHYEVALNKIKLFLKYQYLKEDIILEDINHAFITKFEVFLKTIPQNGTVCSHNTALNHLKKLRRVVNISIANEWLMHDPFRRYKCKVNPTNRGYLTTTELQTLEEKTFTIPRLQKVLDIFIFCCYTGLSWSDAEKLKPSDIKIGIDGEKWIIIYRKKTDSRSPIPLLPQALLIIEKYKNNHECLVKNRLLPVNSNQRMNGYLKEISDICGIEKRLTMHLARHTFATTVTLANGVPIETVSKMLGHTSIKTTQIYSKVVDTKISNDMQALKSKLVPKSIKKAM